MSQVTWKGKRTCQLNRLVIYARDIETMARSYERHFGFKVTRLPGDRIVELFVSDGGAKSCFIRPRKGSGIAISVSSLAYRNAD
jgi:hypothetical protein